MTPRIQHQAERVLQNTFGYQKFRPGQENIINSILAGQDCLVVMPTGGGKSLCYQIPALVMKGITLVVSPLIALMKDQVDQLTACGVKAAYLNSAQTGEQQRAVMHACYSGQIKLLYVSPERLMMTHFLKQLAHWQPSLLAIDEAHCISQWGHDFRPEYRTLSQLKQHFSWLPVMALTATADETTRNDIVHLLNLSQPCIQISSFDRPNIRYTLMNKQNPMHQLWCFIQSQQDKSGIIYCNSRARAEEISTRLHHRGLKVAAYHAGMDHLRRTQIQEEFQRDHVQIVVATVAFGMGINKSNVRFVIHFDISRNIESYYQETGRAGRDNQPAQALLLYDPADIAWLDHCLKEKSRSLQSATSPPCTDQQQDIAQYKLQAMRAFAQAQTCRRLVLLNYFGESRQQICGNCDICLNPPRFYDGLIDGQKALSCVYRVGQCYGLGYIVDLLRGVSNPRICAAGHDTLSVYGIGRTQSSEHWISVLHQLIHLGLLRQSMAMHSALVLTAAALPILRSEAALKLALPRPLSLKKYNNHCQKSHKGHYDTRLFSRLRRLRQTIADEENIPPYVVVHDATLLEMAEKMPVTASELLRINGIGQRKLARFGALFLSAICAHADEF